MDSSKKTFSVTDAEIKRLYRSARRDIYGPWYLQRKVVFSAAVLLLGFAVAWLYLSGFWAKLPFVPESLVPVPSDEEIVANLSALYGMVEITTVKGISMFPAFAHGQKVFVAADYYRNNVPKRGEVVKVSFSAVPDAYIKRIAFVQGDSFTRHGNVFYLNGSDSTAPNKRLVLDHKDILYRQLLSYGFSVPNSSVVVLGDNELDSFDSRSFGLVLVSELSGKVVK